jgi:thiamine-monophosphate kinase
MLRVSGVSASVDLGRLPLSDAATAAIAADPALFEIAATGGDDYEILAAVSPEDAYAFEAAAATAGVRVAFVGVAVEGAAPPRWVGRDGREVSFAHGAFSHF